MNADMVLGLMRETVMTILMVAAPLLAAGLIIGVSVSIFQTVTQIREMTLTFVPKIADLTSNGQCLFVKFDGTLDVTQVKVSATQEQKLASLLPPVADRTRNFQRLLIKLDGALYLANIVVNPAQTSEIPRLF